MSCVQLPNLIVLKVLSLYSRNLICVPGRLLTRVQRSGVLTCTLYNSLNGLLVSIYGKLKSSKDS